MSRSPHRPFAFLRRLPGVLGLALTAAVGCAQDPKDSQDPQNHEDPAALSDAAGSVPSDFVRFVLDGNSGRLDTAVTTYRRGPVEVVFYGAVHIADGSHYEQLQERFGTRDALLYELVGPEDYRPTRGESGGGFVSMLQQGLKNGLELEFQLDGIDYSPANFVHADMTPGEFAASMEERGETLLSMMLSMMQNGPAMQEAMAEMKMPDEVETDLVKAFRSGTGRHTMRMLFASQLEQMELLAAGGGKEGSTLLEGRNEKCLTVLQRELQAGKRRIGIYYGAAHMPHMEQRLVDDLGFHKTGHEWLPAWDCTPRPDPKFDRELYLERRNARRAMARIAAAASAWRSAAGGDGLPTMEQLAATGPDGAPYYDGEPVDPWGNRYNITGNRRGITVSSAGQDGIFFTEDDIDERRR